ARALIADQHHVARHDLAAEDRLDRGVLALEDARGAGERQDALIDAGGLHDAALLGEVAVEDGEAAVAAEGVPGVADHALLAVEVELVPAAALAERLGGRDA